MPADRGHVVDSMILDVLYVVDWRNDVGVCGNESDDDRVLRMGRRAAEGIRATGRRWWTPTVPVRWGLVLPPPPRTRLGHNTYTLEKDYGFTSYCRPVGDRLNHYSV
jgi:hypothetical protein